MVSVKKIDISLLSAIEKLINLFKMILKKEKEVRMKGIPLQTMLLVAAFTLCLFLLFNIVDIMKFICIFSVKLCSFAILKAFLTQFWQLVFAVSNRQPNFL